ncbi:MAG: hypothetical protein A2383_03635 [Candidatus Pacebacteria bacterium RIFOXYB1_FULL_39_46]|nr:MAG: hypothetical protein A2182_03890 [Candidatus Pacebacteria bacterium RIFOXYA1_FULL_38_18]OGJ38507.1 MAG: hypothetical protein A2383_03635 [Candidatus Pacebacteria bacterium RIFOXYB1_FULL_39_46]OGJ40367.1 MAG: hypothetical protein A2411_03775 [Candidatus Pacebacteria bacterium RIFOXYC1_FULL_39_21]OGJ40486.1 MAG: hypothetical protein A2582_02520 [Candidatus Pacebacteria bacterium RIFOXYD1_FULL_39_27]
MQKKDLVPDSSISILLIIPEKNNHRVAALAFLNDQHQKTQPIFFNEQEETLKIDTVRELLQHASFARAKTEPQVIVVCAVQNASLPAQNALLKIVEEPPAHTQIILVTNPGHQLLPTLSSRCREIIWSAEADSTALTGISAEDADQIDATQQTETELLQKLQQVQEFLSNPDSFQYSALIALAEQLQELDTAKQTLHSLLNEISLHNSLNLQPKITQQLLSALDSLEKNGNVKLVLEHAFFTIKQLTTT